MAHSSGITECEGGRDRKGFRVEQQVVCTSSGRLGFENSVYIQETRAYCLSI